MSSFNTIAISLAGGVLPALLWLWFWLKEDRLHPEPRSRIMIVFLAGMASVFLVLPLEKFVFTASASVVSLMTIFLWAGIEEITKLVFAYFTALRKRVVDEPIDTIIYMITIALGFSALENTLFLSNIMDSGLFSQVIVTGNTRFLGATLLHVASSAAIGVMMSLAFYKRSSIKTIFLLAGLFISILLHTIFNLFIIKLESNMFFVFAGIWVLIVVLMVLFEKVKKINSYQG